MREAVIAVATNSSYVFGGLQGSAIRWRAQQWVTNKGPVLNVELWVELLEMLDVARAAYEWIKVPRHVQLDGNERADTLAELGRKASPLYARANRRSHLLLTLVAASPERISPSPPPPPTMDTGSY